MFTFSFTCTGSSSVRSVTTEDLRTSRTNSEDVVVGGMGKDLLARSHLYDRSVAHDDDVVAEFQRLAQVVRDEDDRLVHLLLQAEQFVLHVPAG